MDIIVAHDQNGVIGNGRSIPWYLPADLRHFRKLTTGNAVIMGRETFESIKERLGGPLPHRTNIIMTHQPDLHIEDCAVVHSLDEALVEAEGNGEVFVIGGAQIYHLAMPVANRLFITEVHAEFEGDTFFPPIDASQWQEINREDYVADEQNPYNYSFVEYVRV